MEDARIIGQRLKIARNAMGLNIAELSRKAKVSAPTITNLENGKTKTIYKGTLNALKTVLGDFLSGEMPVDTESRKKVAKTLTKEEELVMHLMGAATLLNTAAEELIAARPLLQRQLPSGVETSETYLSLIDDMKRKLVFLAQEVDYRKDNPSDGTLEQYTETSG